MTPKRSVFITGATGAIGSAIVPALLADPETEVHLLLRAESEVRLGERVRELRLYWGPDVANADERILAHRGDVNAPGLGLDDATRAALANRATHIIHAAGNVKLNQSIDEARADVVGGIKNVITLAQSWRACGPLRKVDYFSTVGVAGRAPGLLAERPMSSARGFHNTYEQAKAEAEELLLVAMTRGLPATIFRPSMVVGDARTGKVIRFQVFYHLAEFLSGKRSAGLVPSDSGFRLDLVPSDYVANAVRAALDDPAAIGRILHLCSGPERSLPLLPLAERLRSTFLAAGDRVPTLRRLPPWLFSFALNAARPFCGEKTRRAIATLPLFLAYLAERQAFANSDSLAYFRGRGLEMPIPDDYFDHILAYYINAKRARAQRPREEASA